MIRSNVFDVSGDPRKFSDYFLTIFFLHKHITCMNINNLVTILYRKVFVNNIYAYYCMLKYEQTFKLITI